MSGKYMRWLLPGGPCSNWAVGDLVMLIAGYFLLGKSRAVVGYAGTCADGLSLLVVTLVQITFNP
jgi:hypothetical protein